MDHPNMTLTREGAIKLFVDTVIWHHNKRLLIVSFDYPQHNSEKGFIEDVRAVLDQNKWEYRANKKGAEIIDMILKEGTE